MTDLVKTIFVIQDILGSFLFSTKSTETSMSNVEIIFLDIVKSQLKVEKGGFYGIVLKYLRRSKNKFFEREKIATKAGIESTSPLPPELCCR